MQKATLAGLRPAERDERRYTIVPIHGANDQMGVALESTWLDRTPEKAKEYLEKPDIQVERGAERTHTIPLTAPPSISTLHLPPLHSLPASCDSLLTHTRARTTGDEPIR